MFEKIKLKRKNIQLPKLLGKKIILFASVFVIGALTLFTPQQSGATVYDPSTDISVHLDTYTKGQGGAYVKNNLIQVGKEVGSATIQAEITLVTPTAGLTLDGTTDRINSGANDINGSGTGSPITALGAGLDSMGQGAGAGGLDCHDDSIVLVSLGRSVVSGLTFGLISPSDGSFHFLKCDFKDSTSPEITGVFKTNTPTKLNVSVNFSQYNINTNNTSTPQQIIIYPYMKVSRLGTSKEMTFDKNGFPIYVQFYDSQAQADQAISSGTRPSGVTPYGGGTTGSATGGQAQGPNPVLGLINQIINALLGLVQEFIYAIFFYLIAPIIQSLLSIHPYTDAFVAVIYPGWEIMRNLCNIFFIVALIIIALATLFRVDSYQYKQLIIQLIIAALLVNFSLVICQAILGLADTVQAQFLPANVTVIRSLAGNLMVSYRSSLFDAQDLFYGTWGNTLQPLFWVALSLGSFCVFCAIAAFLLVRIVALWILMLISPMAYAVGVLPTTAGYRKQWWEMFLKYSFFTPIMAFFLNMTAVIYNTYISNSVLSSLTPTEVTKSLGKDSLSVFVFRVASNILLLIFLIAALKVADLAGIVGASTVTGWAQKGMLAPFGVALGGSKILGGYLGRKYNEKTSDIRGDKEKISFKRASAFAILNPVAFAKGLKKQSEERTHRAQAKAEAAGLEVVEQRFSSLKTIAKGSYKRTPHVLQHEKEEEDEQSNKLGNLSREEVARRAAQIFLMSDDEEGKAYKRGVIKLAMHKGYIDDIVMEAHKTEEGRKMIEEMLAKMPNLRAGLDYKEVALTRDDGHGHQVEVKNADGTTKMVKAMQYNNATRRAMYMAMFGTDDHGHLKDHAAMRLITQEGEKEGMDTGHLEYMTDMRFNEQTGGFEWYGLKETADGWVSDGDKQMAAAEIAKKDSRTQSRIAWHSLMSSDGTSFNRDVYVKVAKAFSENPGFMQERTANKLVVGSTDDDVIRNVREHFAATGELLLDDVSAERIQKMMSVDEKATAAVLQRFINDAGAASITKRLEKGIKIKVVEKNKEGNPILTKNETSGQVTPRSVVRDLGQMDFREGKALKEKANDPAEVARKKQEEDDKELEREYKKAIIEQAKRGNP